MESAGDLTYFCVVSNRWVGHEEYFRQVVRLKHLRHNVGNVVIEIL
jgi:hypothetical protein